MLIAVRLIERSFSDLLRHPNDIAADVESGDVLLRRRDEPDLRLTRADREAERSEVFRALAHAFRSLATHNPKVVEAAIEETFPWTTFLPPKVRREFIDEYARTLNASAAVDTYSALIQVLREWRATAEIYADPKLSRKLRGPIAVPDGRTVAPPAGR